MTNLNSGIWTPDGSVFLGWRQDLEQLPENQAYLASGPRFYLPSNFREPVLIDPRPWMWEVGSAGKNQGPVGSCFPSGTLIRLASGEQRPIEFMRPLDRVITAEGHNCRVNQVMVRDYDGRFGRLNAWGHRHLIATEEHPVLSDRGYISVSKLKTRDWIAIPRACPGDARVLQSHDHLELRHRVLRDRQWKYSGVQGRGMLNVVSTKVPDVIDLNRGFGRIIGLFLAEGCTSRSKVTWTFCIDEETTLVAELVALLKSELDAESTVRRIPEHRTIQVNLFGTQWAHLFESLCSTGAALKRLHSDLSSGNSTFLEAVFSGWMSGDGFIHKRGYTAGTTVSKTLAHQMFDIAVWMGLRPSIVMRQIRPDRIVKHRKPHWNVTIPKRGDQDTFRTRQDDTHLWRRLRSIEFSDLSAPVFNLSVDQDESYIANGIGVHNCSGFGSSTGCEVDQWIDSQGAAHELFSAMFCYLMGQRLAGITGDNGCTISSVVESLTQNGVPRDRTFPYPGRYTSEVPDEAIAEAAKHKILRHHKFTSYDEVYQFLASGQGVIVIGIPWTRELADNRDGIVENPGTEVLGGHCNVLVGLSKRTDRAGRNYGIDINSHGLAWGYKGTAEFSPAVIDHYGADGYSELIGISKLETYEDGPRRTSWFKKNPW